MGKILKYFIVGFIILSSIWLFSLAKCELYSALYGDEFYGLDESSTNMVEKSDNVKVLKYTQKNATVYYYNKSGACIFEFERNNIGWQMVMWDSVWSSTGSSSEIIWPYWWHFIYGGL